MTHSITLSDFDIELIEYTPVDFVKSLRMAFGLTLKEAVDVKNLIRDKKVDKVVIKTIASPSKIWNHQIRNYIGSFEGGGVSGAADKFDDLVTALLAENKPELAAAIDSIFKIYKKGI